MARIYRRHPTGSYYADYQTPEGVRIKRSLRTRDHGVAKQRAKLAELAATPATRGRKQKLSDAIDYMITATLLDRAEPTREMYREKGRRIATTLGDPLIQDVTRDMLSGYIARRLGPEPGHGGASAHTVSKELITIRKALREAHERGVLRVLPPMPRFSAKYKPKEVWLTPDQFELLCAEIDPRRRLWAALAALAGGNHSEVEAVAWETTDLVANRLLVPGTKRETRRRWVPIAPALQWRLDAVPEAERHGKVVAGWQNVRRDLHAAVARANKKGASPPLPKISPNDLRRTFASWLVQQDVPLLTVATLLGHSSTRMVEKVYGKLSRANLESAIAMLPNPTRPDPT